MSRAFVKDLEDVPDVRIDVRAPQRPITPGGFASLQRRFDAASDPEEKAAMKRVLDDVVPIAAPEDRRRVAFGARVIVRGAAESDRAFTIVGEDEIDVERGFIGESSPLAQALLGKKTGSTAVWERPAGKRKVSIVSIVYDEADPSAA